MSEDLAHFLLARYDEIAGAVERGEATDIDVDAKRMIVFDWLAAVRRTDDDGRPEHLTNPTLSMIIKSHYRWLCWLAKPFEHHPDYREEWRP